MFLVKTPPSPLTGLLRPPDRSPSFQLSAVHKKLYPTSRDVQVDNVTVLDKCQRAPTAASGDTCRTTVP